MPDSERPSFVERLIEGHRNQLSDTSSAEQFRVHRIELNAKLRAVYIAGAEERSLAETGRGLTAEELRAVLVAFPKDLPVEP